MQSAVDDLLFSRQHEIVKLDHLDSSYRVLRGATYLDRRFLGDVTEQGSMGH